MQSGHQFRLPTFRTYNPVTILSILILRTCNPVTISGFQHSERAIRSPFQASDTPNVQSGHQFRYPDTCNAQNNLLRAYRLKMSPHPKRMRRHFCMPLHPAKKIGGDGEKAQPANAQSIALQDPVSPMAIGANRPYRRGNPCRCNAWDYWAGNHR